ncbi:hypothetical protein [Pseudomonas sp. IPO3778]|uniref:hypothetical protein n=1 Tax=unclassified Pseudomonas TaxID=196821 RepID=UPI0035BFFB89
MNDQRYALAHNSITYHRTENMLITCPNCHSTHVSTKDLGKKTGGTIGVIGGGTSGVAGAIKGAELGAAIGITGGPLGITLGGIAGAILGGLIGAGAGGMAGAAIGEQIDDRIFNNYHCAQCHYQFSL